MRSLSSRVGGGRIFAPAAHGIVGCPPQQAPSSAALVAGIRSGRLDRREFEAATQRVLDLRASLPRQIR
jgi:hypothetical protein